MVVFLSMMILFAADPDERRPCVALAPGETIRVDLAEAPLSELARLVSCALDKNLLFQPASLGAKQVTVLGPRPIGPRDLEALWRAVLADHDLVEERHGAYQVVRPVTKR